MHIIQLSGRLVRLDAGVEKSSSRIDSVWHTQAHRHICIRISGLKKLKNGIVDNATDEMWREREKAEKKINFKMPNIVHFYIINDMATHHQQSNSHNKQITNTYTIAQSHKSEI